MRAFLRREWTSLRAQWRGVEPFAAFVLLSSVVLVLVQQLYGSRRVFREHLADFVDPAWDGVLAWGWWFGFQGLTGFVLPLLFALVLFRRSPRKMGLGLGDWRLAGTIALAYLPLVAVGTWVLSADPAFQDDYPHYGPAAFDWRFFAVYEALFLFYWIGWEYLWRGYVLFGTAPALGPGYAILAQTVPFALLHLDKPPAEALLSIVGGVALGALVWRCRSFWIAVPIHAAQMIILDLWCTLRLRAGENGLSLEALLTVLGLR